jgi:hypothetical protein
MHCKETIFDIHMVLPEDLIIEALIERLSHKCWIAPLGPQNVKLDVQELYKKPDASLDDPQIPGNCNPS